MEPTVLVRGLLRLLFLALLLPRAGGGTVAAVHRVNPRARYTILFARGLRLFEAAPGRKEALWVEGAGHDDPAWVAGERYWAALREFAEGVG